MTAREVARLRDERSDTPALIVDRHADGTFTVHTPAGHGTATADTLAQLVCDLGAHVGPVADRFGATVSRWELPSGGEVLADRHGIEAPARSSLLDPQDARRLALTLLVAATVAEQQAGEVA